MQSCEWMWCACTPTPPAPGEATRSSVLSQGAPRILCEEKLLWLPKKAEKTMGWLEKPDLHAHVQHSSLGGWPRVGDKPLGGRDGAGYAEPVSMEEPCTKHLPGVPSLIVLATPQGRSYTSPRFQVGKLRPGEMK